MSNIMSKILWCYVFAQCNPFAALALAVICIKIDFLAAAFVVFVAVVVEY
jgi:hypothetical protein